MDKKEKCITNCYEINKTENQKMIHPFIGIKMFEKPETRDVGKCGINKISNYSYFGDCNKNTPYENNLQDSIKVPMEPENYLQLYFNIQNIGELIKYISINKEMLQSTKSRLLDFAYITYGNNIENDIINWTSLIKTVFDSNLIKDEVIIKILKKINSKYKFNKNNYPFNLLLKINKFLDYNI